MANGCHLITLRLDIALIDDVGRGEVVDEVFLASVSPGRPCRDVLGAFFWGDPVLGELACSAMEAFLLVVSCFSGLTLVVLICMLVLRCSWFLAP